jgi:hypothetical protein
VRGEERIGLVESVGEGEAAHGEGERVAGGGGGEGGHVDGLDDGDGAVRVVLQAEALLADCARERGSAGADGGREHAAEEAVSATAAAEEKRGGCHLLGQRRATAMGKGFGCLSVTFLC